MNKSVLKQVLSTLIFLLVLAGCSDSDKVAVEQAENGEKKVGILLVNHGSVSEKWRNMLTDVDSAVKDKLLANAKISDVKTAFMEYTEPSIATQMKAFDKAGYDEVVLVPLFLTVSSHSLTDIPTILGINADPKVIATLAKEKIEVYRAKARVTITPNLDFTTLLKKNVLRRVKALSDGSGNEGLVLVAYGDKDYNQQWEEMMDEIGRFLKIKLDMDTVAYAWCGHLVNYSTEPTEKAIEQVFELEDRVLVVPLLVAFDPYFQIEIIETATKNVENSQNVIYKPDAILPDDNLNDWVVDITNQVVSTI
ncbi:MAG: cobalamin biosynthesis protein CbiX [Methylococcales symbiont of Hymedesmia sp. n. MRB-2018]|nr:MAG: cobalamin biosynthesis protein CbiX [Methylococcales symbiont of Hymedesmia sp. n. MRB-2018]KAF3984588.1 MAG: cobalamin biosynthesis protein CbiX [Methylococcales symbiont of Hymedesmia sp. n. MRB-2018]